MAIESTARHWRQSGERRASLGRLATAAAPVAAAPLPRLRVDPVALRSGSPLRTYKVDGAGRIKFSLGAELAPVASAWRPGALDVVIVEGWATLTQPEELIGAAPTRNSGRASYAIAGTDGRIQLRRAHLEALGAGVGVGHHLLLGGATRGAGLFLVAPEEARWRRGGARTWRPRTGHRPARQQEGHGGPDVWRSEAEHRPRVDDDAKSRLSIGRTTGPRRSSPSPRPPPQRLCSASRAGQQATPPSTAPPKRSGEH